MNPKDKIVNVENLELVFKKNSNIESNLKYKRKISIYLLIFLIILLLLVFEINLQKKEKLVNLETHLDEFETSVYNEIKPKVISIPHCSDMLSNQREFLNGLVRKFRPKKIIEIGVKAGGSSIIILNAIKDIENSKLYSIDISSNPSIGNCAKKNFSYLLYKWKLYSGKIAADVIEEIGNDIDLAFIDSAHFEPGEILDFLIILPFLKEGGIVCFHDIANQITINLGRNEWAPYIIFNSIRGQKFLPSGNNILTHDIGAVKVDSDQKRYYHDYFRYLGGQWQYFPKEIHIKTIKNLFQKYYDDKCLKMFEEAVNFNRAFVKKFPKFQLYKTNSDNN